jgi:hypothetical protein
MLPAQGRNELSRTDLASEFAVQKRIAVVSGRELLCRSLHVLLNSRWLYQFNQRWSVRLTAQYDSLVVNPTLTSLDRTKQINGDILIAYRLNPATAFFVGYNYDTQNYDRRAVGNLPPLADEHRAHQ